jgi:hypothetical protein
MHYGASQSEIDSPGKVIQIKLIFSTEPSIYSICQSGLDRSPYEAFNHFLLQVDAYDFSCGTDHACERQREKSLATSYIQSCHALFDVCDK